MAIKMKKQYLDDDIRETLSMSTVESAVIEAKIQEAYAIIRENAGDLALWKSAGGRNYQFSNGRK